MENNEVENSNKYLIFISIIGLGIGLMLLFSGKKEKPKKPEVKTLYKTRTKVIVVNQKNEVLADESTNDEPDEPSEPINDDEPESVEA